MATRELTNNQIIKWLQQNQSRINVSEFANEISLDVSQLKKAINRVKITKNGAICKIPQRCIPACNEAIRKFREIPTKAEAQM